LSERQKSLVQQLSTDTQNAVRLFGCAAVPAHFPPFVGNPLHRSLTNRRIAALLKNGRRTTRHLLKSAPGIAAEFNFAHGLFVTLASTRLEDERAARETVAEMCSDLKRKDLPLRHAGSFGFDFAAAEWARDRLRNRYVVRLAAADLPTPIWDAVVGAVAAWWSERTHVPDTRARAKR
jgi:hypothetical protein